jgi:glycosyltransferase involved in cell wall biosynthesis
LLKTEQPLRLEGRKVLISDEALVDFKGHFYSWIKAIRQIHLDEGAEVMVAANSKILPEICEEFNCFKIFSVNSWSGIYDYLQWYRRYYAVFRHNLRLFFQIRKLLRKLDFVDCIILPAVRIHQLMAWRAICRFYLGKRFGKIVIFVLTSEATYDPQFSSFSFRPSSKLIQSVLRSFKDDVTSGNVILAGDSEITCREYETLSGLHFTVFPSPVAGMSVVRERRKPHSQICSFTLLGVSVIDKGVDILQKAILQLLDENPSLPAHFFIQWGVRTIDYDGQPVDISPTLRQSSLVTIMEKTLSEEEYSQYLHQSDFLILPYRRKVYFNRISGVAVEAASAGIPMIVTENTWLESAMLAYGAGLSVRDGDATDLKEKILTAIRDRSMLKEKAEMAKPVARAFNSPKRYLDNIWT